jgi:putative acetyltransferase
MIRHQVLSTGGVESKILVDIRTDDLSGPEIAALLTEHLDAMAQVSPPESRHAMVLERLRGPGNNWLDAAHSRKLIRLMAR